MQTVDFYFIVYCENCIVQLFSYNRHFKSCRVVCYLCNNFSNPLFIENLVISHFHYGKLEMNLLAV